MRSPVARSEHEGGRRKHLLVAVAEKLVPKHGQDIHNTPPCIGLGGPDHERAPSEVDSAPLQGKSLSYPQAREQQSREQRSTLPTTRSSLAVKLLRTIK